MESEKNYHAIWVPGWYELDQSLTVDQRQKFWFFQQTPPEYAGGDSKIDLVFFNELDAVARSEIRFADVVSISHPQMGELAKIDTEGLDYIFVPLSGEEFVVNAEEEPGKVYTGLQIVDWTVQVTLTNVSAPVSNDNASDPADTSDGETA